MEDPEEGWGAPPGTAPPSDMQQEDKQQRNSSSKENNSPAPKRRKFRSFEIQLQGAPTDGLYCNQVFT